MSNINCIKFRIHYITSEGIVMFIPIKDEENLLLGGGLYLNTSNWPSVTEEYRRAKKQGKLYIFNGEKFRMVDRWPEQEPHQPPKRRSITSSPGREGPPVSR